MADVPVTPLRFAAFGGRGPCCQITRIENGLRSLGWLDSTANGAETSLVYANDAERWQEAIEYRAMVAPQAKLILCCLDLAEWCYPSYNPYALLPLLRQADAVCSISKYVQSQLHRYFGLGSHIIYNPIMGVTPDTRESGGKPYPQFRAMMVGRLRDPSKRADLAVKALLMAGFSEEEVAIVGSEPIGWGTYMGVVADNVLNDLYNSVDYVMCCSQGGGLELPPIEGMVCGAIPILCHDLTTFHEGWYPRAWGCYPNSHSIAYRLRTLIDNPELRKGEQQHCLAMSEGLRKQLGAEAVARRIVEVYRKLVEVKL